MLDEICKVGNDVRLEISDCDFALIVSSSLVACTSWLWLVWWKSWYESLVHNCTIWRVLWIRIICKLQVYGSHVLIGEPILPILDEFLGRRVHFRSQKLCYRSFYLKATILAMNFRTNSQHIFRKKGKGVLLYGATPKTHQKWEEQTFLLTWKHFLAKLEKLQVVLSRSNCDGVIDTVIIGSAKDSKAVIWSYLIFVTDATDHICREFLCGEISD